MTAEEEDIIVNRILEIALDCEAKLDVLKKSQLKKALKRSSKPGDAGKESRGLV